MFDDSINAFMILGSPLLGFHPLYRGVARSRPDGLSLVNLDERLAELYFEYLEKAHEAVYFTDERWLSKAMEFASRINLLPLGFTERFEVVVASDQLRPRQVNLGFDLAIGFGDSLLAGWRTSGAPHLVGVGVGGPDSAYAAIYNKYEPLLNSNILFADREIAEECLHRLDAFRRRYPGVLEIGDAAVVSLAVIMGDG